jgi:hypothetical protein
MPTAALAWVTILLSKQLQCQTLFRELYSPLVHPSPKVSKVSYN